MTTIALAGNPNSGKTTLFNTLTGSNQFVGNWPGVTVEKKEGSLKKYKDVKIMDLPGVYSLSPYTMEEVISRDYLINEKPDVILNIIDGTNLERNLYLTTQLIELGIPVVVAVNMMDVAEKNCITVDVPKLEKELLCPVVEISALKKTGIEKLITTVLETAAKDALPCVHKFDETVESVLKDIENIALGNIDNSQKRFFQIKLFERDEKVVEKLALNKEIMQSIESVIQSCEEALDDDAESIITAGRYSYITEIIGNFYCKVKTGLTLSDKIDRVVTNRFLALPIFAVVMFVVYFIAVTSVGGLVTDFTNDGLFGEGWHLFGNGEGEYETAAEEYATPQAIIEAFETASDEAGAAPEHAENLTATAVLYDDDGNIEEEIPVTYSTYMEAASLEEPDPANYGIWVSGIPVVIGNALDAINCAPWLKGLILDGMIAGVGAVLGFVPQMFILFLMLAFLEACGYMARIAFIMDRIFRKFGLSGKSFIPMLIGTGCGVPGIMASRTIENDRDRKMTIITTTFIPCSAKLPIIALIAGALFGGAWWVAPSAYFIGMASIVISGVILKKTRLFKGDPAPFVMELPAYHMPTVSNLLYSMWERGWSFIKKAGTIILLATILIWFASSYGFSDGGFGLVEMEDSILAFLGNSLAWIFSPLGWGNWQATVASITGLVAKENVVGTFGVLFGGFEEVAENGWQVWINMQATFTTLSAYSFLVFNLLCAPCFAAIGAIRREMNNWKWTAFAVGYQCGFAYAIAMIIYQLGMLFTTGIFTIGTLIGIILLLLGIFLFLKPQSRKKLVHKTFIPSNEQE